MLSSPPLVSSLTLFFTSSVLFVLYFILSFPIFLFLCSFSLSSSLPVFQYFFFLLFFVQQLFPHFVPPAFPFFLRALLNLFKYSFFPLCFFIIPSLFTSFILSLFLLLFLSFHVRNMKFFCSIDSGLKCVTRYLSTVVANVNKDCK